MIKLSSDELKRDLYKFFRFELFESTILSMRIPRKKTGSHK